MKEYGGYLPFELKEGIEYYSGLDVVPLNCARNGIVYSMIVEGYEKIYIPFYMCITIKNTLEKHNISYEMYHIDEAFNPINVNLKKKECILYPNYFGLQSKEKIMSIIEKFQNVILDNTQAFFSEPVEGVYNVYSCRKFIGVSDGAYVIKKNIKHLNLKKDTSYNNALYLLKSIEEGTNSAYKESLYSEKRFESEPILEMSDLTRKILSSVDYQEIKEKRMKNFDCLNTFLIERGFDGIERGEQIVPMIYPFYSKDILLRKNLLQHRVYVPQWWKYLINEVEINNFELKLVNELNPLPIDQRYGKKDMHELADIISKCTSNT